VYVMKAQGRTPQRELSRLQSGMSGVNILPKARTGQLPLALAERPLDRNGAVKGLQPFYGSTGKRLLSVMMYKDSWV
jgi:hypothetical protein